MSMYQQITSRILEQLKNGVIPWRKPWRATADKNLVSNQPYRGINVFLLGLETYTCPYWLTYKQAQERGGHVRKGEHGTQVIFWNFVKKEEDEDSYAMLKKYTLFNAEQCEGIDVPVPAPREFDPIWSADQLIANMPNKPAIYHNGRDRAYYRPADDSVHLPEQSSFISSAHYYSTALHELAHSTGHIKRLARPGIELSTNHGDYEYSKEELVAEMTAAMLCGVLGIENTILENSASYIAGWLDKLDRNPTYLIQAAALAQKAADYIRDVHIAEMATE